MTHRVLQTFGRLYTRRVMTHPRVSAWVVTLDKRGPDESVLVDFKNLIS